MRHGPVLELVEGFAEVTTAPLPPRHRLGGTDLEWLLKILVAGPVIGHGQMKDGRARTRRVDSTCHGNQRSHEEQKREDRRAGDDPEHDHERAVENPVTCGQKIDSEGAGGDGRWRIGMTPRKAKKSTPPAETFPSKKRP